MSAVKLSPAGMESRAPLDQLIAGSAAFLLVLGGVPGEGNPASRPNGIVGGRSRPAPFVGCERGACGPAPSVGGRGSEVERRGSPPPEQKVRSCSARAPLLLLVGPAGALFKSAAAAAKIRAVGGRKNSFLGFMT